MKLMQLELKKINWRPYLGAACGLLAFGLFIALLFCFLPESERGVDDAQFSGSWNSLILLVSCVSMFSFTILGAVLGSKVILDGYLGKKVLLLFSYPVDRRRMFASKTAVSFLFTAGSAFASNMLSVLAAVLVSRLGGGLPGEFLISNGAHLLICSICISLLSACTSLIAVWFGFRKKSATTVIISALILTAPMTNFASAGMYGWMSLAGFAAVMGSLYFIVYRSLSRKVSLMEVL